MSGFVTGASMKSLGGFVITWVWWAIIVEIVLAKPSIITAKETASLGYPAFPLDLGGVEEYPAVIQELRNALANGAPVCNFPVTAKTIADDNRFVLVVLSTTSEKTIELIIDVTDVYVVGYLDLYKGNARLVFLKDVPSATSKIFPGVTNRKQLPFDGSYTKLQNAAKVDRKDLELGFDKLGFAMEAIYGKDLNGKDIAKFFLIAIQMFSEAARFKYIENEVVNNGLYGSFTPNPKVLNLENNWGAISDAIHKSSPQCATINPALQLKTPSNDPWVVREVSQIRPDLGMLKFKSSKLTQFATIIRSIVVEDLDGDELEILEPNVA